MNTSGEIDISRKPCATVENQNIRGEVNTSRESRRHSEEIDTSGEPEYQRRGKYR
jgi:hypothetical protein